jgi:AcrR family transcriptional regulator
MPAAGAPPDRSGRPGRRSKVTDESIAAAVLDIGLDRATIKGVAEHLGMSVAGLYHHVRGREDLLRIASEHLLGGERLPPASDRSWSDWLAKVAHVLRHRLTSHPELLAQYLGGATAAEGAPQLEAALSVLADFGFSPTEAFDAYQSIGQLAVGAAVDDVRERALVDTGRSTIAQLHGALTVAPDELRHVAGLLDGLGLDPADRFAYRVELLLRGIAAERGETI